MKATRTADARLMRAAYEWWRAHRPLAYGRGARALEAHLDFPCVNTSSDSETRLARAVAAYVREKGVPE